MPTARRAAIVLFATTAMGGAIVQAQVLPANPAPPAKELQKYVSVPAGRVILTHANVIDGTGAPVRRNQTVIIEGGRIVSIAPDSDQAVTNGKVIDLSGKTIFPGIVGMHNHLFHIAIPNGSAAGGGESPYLVPQMSFSAPRLYLAGGVTTIRTAGSVEPDADLNLKRAIDAGQLIGPNIDVTAPYVEGDPSLFVQMSRIVTAAQARASVDYWADRGATSFKIYNNVSRAVLKATIDAAHARKLKVTGHLCSVTYPEAIAAGIDNLEHGFFPNTQFDPGKKPDACPETEGRPTMDKMVPDGPEAKALIASLVANRVTLTSTLPVLEPRTAGRPPLSAAARAAMSPQALQSFEAVEARYATLPPAIVARVTGGLTREMALERSFVAAGGMLMAGPDPTGDGGIVPGFADQRGIELLVEAGFSAEQAIQIATLNGARFLGLQDRIGSIAVGKNADIVVVAGDPTNRIEAVRDVEIVFKNGIGFDSKTIIASTKGRFGQY